jgi:hypothetical protein
MCGRRSVEVSGAKEIAMERSGFGAKSYSTREHRVQLPANQFLSLETVGHGRRVLEGQMVDWRILSTLHYYRVVSMPVKVFV